MNVIEERLAVQDVIVLDGAFATELEARGFSVNDALWSAKALFERPDLVREVHLDYLRAGADVVTSASYQATVEGFQKRGFSAEEAAALLQTSVHLAQEARDLYLAEHGAGGSAPLVAASVGPYGAYLADGSEYRGNYGIDEDALTAFHTERLAILAAAHPDLLACETLPCLVEARAVVRALREKEICIPAWFSFSCRDAAHISDGTPIAVCARWLDSVPEAAAVGLNCTAPQHVQQKCSSQNASGLAFFQPGAKTCSPRGHKQGERETPGCLCPPGGIRNRSKLEGGKYRFTQFLPGHVAIDKGA